MTTALMEDFCITSDKLDEWKGVIPRAGPKYRLGMYFDTIHEIPEFDAIYEPDGGYRSCWETETELETDDEYKSFIFAKVDGDSASVVCVDDDEAMELIERWKTRQPKNDTTICEITESSKKPGSDGTYENVDGEDIPPEEHIYESIEDCVAGYQIVVPNDNYSPTNTPTHAPVTQKQKQTSPVYKQKRTNSLPLPPSEIPLKFTRKFSDCTEYSKLNRRHVDKTLYSGLPPPLPPPNSTEMTTNSEYAQLFKLAGKTSPQHETNKQSTSPNIILKHKGKAYILPIADNTKSKDKTRRHSSSQATPKHMPSSTSHNPLRSSQSVSQVTCLTHAVPRSESMGFQVHPKPQTISSKTEMKDLTKRKSKHNSTHSSCYQSSVASSQSTKSHVTLYGVF